MITLISHTPNTGGGDAELDINAPDLGDRVFERARKTDGSVRDGTIWARYLNRDMKKGLSGAVGDQLLGKVSALSLATLGLTAVFTAANANPDFSPKNITFNALLTSLVQQGIGIGLAKWKYDTPLRERRLSLIPAYQLDRMAIGEAPLWQEN